MNALTRLPVLCGIDASPEARFAAHFAATIAERLDAPLVLAHVADAPVFSASPPLVGATLGHSGAAATRESRHGAREDGLLLLDEAARGLRVQPDAQLRSGDPASELLGLLEETGAEMVVAGAHPRAAFERSMTGTVWCRLTAAARCPVAVISPRAEVSCEGPVVAGYDGSDHSQRAILVAAGLAVRLRTRLLLVNVAGDGRDAAPLDQVSCMWLRQAAAAAAAAKDKTRGDDPHPPSPALELQCQMRRGEPHVELERAAAAEGAGMIVAGSRGRGRGPWRSALLGSVSAGLVETAARPVVIVPADET